MAKSKKPPRLWLARGKGFGQWYHFCVGPRRRIKQRRTIWFTENPAEVIKAMHPADHERIYPHLTLDPGTIRGLEPPQFKPEKKRRKKR